MKSLLKNSSFSEASAGLLSLAWIACETSAVGTSVAADAVVLLAAEAVLKYAEN